MGSKGNRAVGGLVADVSDELRDEVYAYLDDLRESGETNMFLSPPYVQDCFALDERTARALVADWMTTFAERHPREAS
jgi:hypothetical protein